MTQTKPLYVDFHVLQTVPPSCVNRDDTGSPKTAVYGGETRARISSQAWKHSMREYFKTLYTPEELGLRTKYVIDKLTTAMHRHDDTISEDSALKTAEEILAYVGIKNDKDKKLDALFFISAAQIEALVKLSLEGCKDKKAYQKALMESPSVDMALFGRMVASDPSLNYDAAAQVAHSISTHGIHNEYDYFTAVDDCSPEDNAGAGHLGTVEYNSATLYRYATVNVNELASTLEGDIASVVRNFAEAFVRSMPTGKQNTFANRTLPDCVYVTVRCDQPVNLSGAFERAVRANSDGYVAESEKRLTGYAEEVYANYAGKPLASFAVGAALSGIANVMSFNELLNRLEETVSDIIKEKGIAKS